MGQIIALVGPSQSGKTTLTLSAVDTNPEKFAVLKSVTTRAWREPQDDRFYKFISVEEYLDLEQRGELVTSVTLAGNHYGTPRTELQRLIAKHHVIWAMLETSALAIRASQRPTKIVKIIPEQRDLSLVSANIITARLAEDEARAKINLEPDFTLINSFAPGGRERALQDFIAYLNGL
jgi:guanylate kinase